MLQCVAVCCSVLQCVAACCSASQCVAVRRSVLLYVAVCCSVLLVNLIHVSHIDGLCTTYERVTSLIRTNHVSYFVVQVDVCCSVLQCVAVCCSVLQCVPHVSV